MRFTAIQLMTYDTYNINNGELLDRNSPLLNKVILELLRHHNSTSLNEGFGFKNREREFCQRRAFQL